MHEGCKLVEVRRVEKVVAMKNSLKPLGLVLCVLWSVFACAHEAKEEPPRPAVSQREAAPDPAQPGEPRRRAVAREIQVNLRAKNPSTIVEQVTALTESSGGYIVNSDVRVAGAGELGAELSVRLPVSKLDAALSLLRRLGEVQSETRRGDDLTAEVVDTEARLTARRALERRLLELLSNAHNVEDMLKVESELARVRTEIEQLVGQSRALEQKTELVLLKVSIVSPDADRVREPSFGIQLKAACASAVHTSGRVILGFVELLGALLPLAIIAVAIAWPLRMLWSRAKRQQLVGAIPGSTQPDGTRAIITQPQPPAPVVTPTNDAED